MRNVEPAFGQGFKRSYNIT